MVVILTYRLHKIRMDVKLMVCFEHMIVSQNVWLPNFGKGFYNKGMWSLYVSYLGKVFEKAILNLCAKDIEPNGTYYCTSLYD